MRPVRSRCLWVLWLALRCGFTAVAGQPATGAGGVRVVRDLRRAMYPGFSGTNGCCRLLNATDAVGCGELPGSPNSEAVLAHLSDLREPLTEARAVVAPAADVAPLLGRLADDADFAAMVHSVLVDDTDLPPAWSSEPPFPGADYAPYPPGDHAWNPAGSRLNSLRVARPVVALTPELAAEARARAAANRRAGFRGALHKARVAAEMSAVQADAASCLAARACAPLGGFSVLAALPPLPPPGAPPDGRRALVVAAQMDGTDLFHDLIQGADAPVSGLIALVAAAYALHSGLPPGAPDAWAGRVVFLALAGEPWGYLGSRRLLWECAAGGVAVEGLRLEDVDQVIEIGQVGRALAADGAALRLFAHSQRGPPWGDAAPLVAALRAAAPPAVEVGAASAANPGIPPSSLMSFLRVRPAVAGVVLTEFDSAFTNPYYGSRFDNATNGFRGEALAPVALAVAGAALRLVGGDPAALQADTGELQALVATLVECLLLPVPGLACPAATAVMQPSYRITGGVRNYAARHYVGVLQTMTLDPQNPSYKPDVARFVWNLLAAATMQGAAGASCDHAKHACPPGLVCAGWRGSDSDPARMGHCVNASVRYIPALSTRIACTACDRWADFSAFRWVETNASDAWLAQHAWPPEPMWVESNWPMGTPSLELFLGEDPATEAAVLGAGVGVAVASVLGAWAARRAFHQHLKSS